MKKAIIAIAGAGLLASACASDPYGYNNGSNETVRQGAIGDPAHRWGSDRAERAAFDLATR